MCTRSALKAPTFATGSRRIRLRRRCSGKDTALPSLELGIDLNFLAGQCENSYSCAYLNTLAWTSPTTPLPTENNPRIVFERLFGDGGTPEGAGGTCAQEAKPAGLGPRRPESTSAPARARRSRRRDRLRGRRARSGAANCQRGGAAIRSCRSWIDRRGFPERFDEHVKLMYELQWLAFRADLTRVVTFMLGRELNFRTYPEIGVTEGHHGLSHHQDRPEQIAKYAKVGVYQAELFSGFPREAAVDARWRRDAARSLAAALRRRTEQSQYARAHGSAAARRRRPRQPHRGEPPPRVPRPGADDESAADAARQGGRPGRHARRQQWTYSGRHVAGRVMTL